MFREEVSLFVDGAMSNARMFIELVSLRRKKKAIHDRGMFAVKCDLTTLQTYLFSAIIVSPNMGLVLLH